MTKPPLCNHIGYAVVKWSGRSIHNRQLGWKYVNKETLVGIKHKIKFLLRLRFCYTGEPCFGGFQIKMKTKDENVYTLICFDLLFREKEIHEKQNITVVYVLPFYFSDISPDFHTD